MLAAIVQCWQPNAVPCWDCPQGPAGRVHSRSPSRRLIRYSTGSQATRGTLGNLLTRTVVVPCNRVCQTRGEEEDEAKPGLEAALKRAKTGQSQPSGFRDRYALSQVAGWLYHLSLCRCNSPKALVEAFKPSTLSTRENLRSVLPRGSTAKLLFAVDLDGSRPGIDLIQSDSPRHVSLQSVSNG